MSDSAPLAVCKTAATSRWRVPMRIRERMVGDEEAERTWYLSVGGCPDGQMDWGKGVNTPAARKKRLTCAINRYHSRAVFAVSWPESRHRSSTCANEASVLPVRRRLSHSATRLVRVSPLPSCDRYRRSGRQPSSGGDV